MCMQRTVASKVNEPVSGNLSSGGTISCVADILISSGQYSISFFCIEEAFISARLGHADCAMGAFDQHIDIDAGCTDLHFTAFDHKSESELTCH